MRRLLIGLLAAAAPLLMAPSVEDVEETPLVGAVTDELERTVESLSVEDFSAPYYASATVFEIERVLCTARDGGLLQHDRDHVRRLRLDIRVGDWEFDSGNVQFGGLGSGGGSLGSVPVDDEYDAIRRRVWSRADRAYKSAAENLEKKRAIFDQLAGDEGEVPSYTQVEPVRTALDENEQDLDKLECEELATEISGLYGDDPEVEGGRTMVSARNVERYFVDTEGALVYEPKTTAFVDAVGRARADDGNPVKHFFSEVAHDVEGLPSKSKLMDQARSSVERLKEMKEAPRADFYTGPVLFEAEAATQLMWRLLSSGFSGTPDPITSSEAETSDFDPITARLDRRLLPDAFDVVDDPRIDELGGEPLIGSYAVDHEGVRAERVELVQDGILETLLMSRTPRDEIRESNGHGRTVSGEVRAKVGNLLFRPEGGMSKSELRDRLLEEAKNDGLEEAYIVRLLDNSAMTYNAFDPGSRFSGGSKIRPLVVIRIDTDGTEELVRGLSIDRPLVRELERIVAWGEAPTISNYLVAGYSGTFMGRDTDPLPPVGQSIASPSLLFEEVSMPTRAQKEVEHRYLPPPGRDE